MKDIVKIFTVTKNETDLIEDFVVYHGSIFGFSNLILIDNDSDCPTVLALYGKFRRMGVVVENHPSYRGQSQGQAFTKFMSKYRRECRFMVGLDTDEFIQFPDFLTVNPEKTSVPYLRNRFRAYFSTLPRGSSKFNVVTYFNSVPDPSAKCYTEQRVGRPAKDIIHFQRSVAKPKKCFFRSETFVSTVNGCHDGKSSRGGEFLTDLCYVHFHDTGARRSVERARNIVCGYGYADVDSGMNRQLRQLAEVRSPIGSHRVLEYALFLSKTLTLEELVRRGLWPSHPSHLLNMAMTFPSVLGFNLLRAENLVKLPSDWSKKFDDVILYDKPLSPGVSSSHLIRNILDHSPQASPRRPAVALMLSGHLRNFKRRESFWKKFVADFPDVDIFVHTWSDGGGRGKTEWIDVGKNKNSHDEARSILNPVEMVVEDHEALFDSFSFRQQGVDLYYTHFNEIRTTEDFTKCIGSQLYSVKRCFELTQKSKKTYDVYVRLRGDSIVENFGSLMNRCPQHVAKNTVVVNGSDNHVHPGGGRGCRKCDLEYGFGVRKHAAHSNDVCDIFYFGRFDAMSRLCRMYDSVNALVRGFQAGNRKNSENPTVKKYLRKFGDVTTVSSSHVYENIIKCFYPERLIREFMKDFWLVSDTLGLVPKVYY